MAKHNVRVEFAPESDVEESWTPPARATASPAHDLQRLLIERLPGQNSVAFALPPGQLFESEFDAVLRQASRWAGPALLVAPVVGLAAYFLA